MTKRREPAAEDKSAGRGTASLLIDPVFGPFFAAKMLATAGIWIHNLVAAVLAFELSGSTFIVGLVSVAQFGPQLFLTPLAGAMADRGDRRRQLVVGVLLVGSASGLLAIWISFVGVDGLPGPWPILAAAAVNGLGFVLMVPAGNALVPALVRPEELAPAIALNSAPPTIARAVGPAIGAAVTASLGAASAFGIAALVNFLYAIVMMRLRIRPREKAGAAPDFRVRAGLRYLQEDRSILVLLLGIAAIGIGADPAITLTPALADGFGGGASLAGVFASAFGVGAGLVFVVFTPLRRRLALPRLGTTGLVILALGMAAAGISTRPVYVGLALALAGAGMTLSLASLTTQVQARAPEHLRGRIMALWAMAFLGSRPLAAAANGAIADATAPMVALLVVALVVLAASWLCRPAVVLRST